MSAITALPPTTNYANWQLAPTQDSSLQGSSSEKAVMSLCIAQMVLAEIQHCGTQLGKQLSVTGFETASEKVQKALRIQAAVFFVTGVFSFILGSAGSLVRIPESPAAAALRDPRLATNNALTDGIARLMDQFKNNPAFLKGTLKSASRLMEAIGHGGSSLCDSSKSDAETRVRGHERVYEQFRRDCESLAQDRSQCLNTASAITGLLSKTV